MKLWLRHGDLVSALRSQYVPTYRGRAARLRELGAESSHSRANSSAPVLTNVAWRRGCKLGEFEIRRCRNFANLATLIGRCGTRFGAGSWSALPHPARVISICSAEWIAAEPIAAKMRGWAAIVQPLRHCARDSSNAGLDPSRRRNGFAAPPDLRRCERAYISPFRVSLRKTQGPASIRAGDELRRGLPVTDSPENLPLLWLLAPARASDRRGLNYNSFLVPNPDLSLTAIPGPVVSRSILQSGLKIEAQ